MKKSFDRLANSYWLLEVLAFGKRLEVVRSSGLKYAKNARRALLIGDGDGRFAAQLLKVNAQLRIHSLDSSRAMLRTARRRIRRETPAAGCHYVPIQADARRFAYAANSYDFIALNFVLDCFQPGAAKGLLQALSHSLEPRGVLFYCDFEMPQGPPHKRLAARWVIRLLYCFFNLVTDIKTSALPELVWPRTLRLAERKTWLGGVLASEIRCRPAGASSPRKADL